LPEIPKKDSELNVFVQSQDPDGDSIAYQYQWIKNDEELFGQTQSTLKSDHFKKGDLIRVKVTPSDGKVNGTPFLSSPMKIINSNPLIHEVLVEPKSAYVTDVLKAKVKSFDLDGDFIYYVYQWEINGVILNDERGDTLERGKFKKGDKIVVIVTPDDRESLGSPKKSDPIVISNSQPVISSSPPTSVEKMTYIYQVKANDPDQDPLTFRLKNGPKKMEIEKDTGLIRWEIKREDKGIHFVEIEVSDDRGAKDVQQYTLTVDFQ
jgi:hypothetical protein